MMPSLPTPHAEQMLYEPAARSPNVHWLFIKAVVRSFFQRPPSPPKWNRVMCQSMMVNCITPPRGERIQADGRYVWLVLFLLACAAVVPWVMR